LLEARRRPEAIRAYILNVLLNVLANVTEDMRMVLWRQRTHAHEFLGADLVVVVEMRNDFVGHVLGTQRQRALSSLPDVTPN
jgi:hypothetical protein